MIALPPGVTINYEVRMTISTITSEMEQWYHDIGGNVYTESWWNGRGQEQQQTILQLPNGRCSYKMQDGMGTVLLSFSQDYAGTALAFLLKFDKYVLSHNMKDLEKHAH